MGRKILIAAPVRQKEEIFIEYLNSLNHLEIPNDVEIKKFFFLHNCSELTKYLNKDEYELITDNSPLIKEINQQKKWTKENFNAISSMRTLLLRKTAEEGYDYLFTIDSDILIHPKTLKLLLNDNKKVVGNMLWTKMENTRIGAICGKDEEWGAYSEEDLLMLQNQPGLFPIGWTCACLLISSEICKNKNISYWPIPYVDNTGCEDYAFCMRVKCNFPDVQIWIDNRLPARHLYHEKDYERWMAEKALYE